MKKLLMFTVVLLFGFASNVAMNGKHVFYEKLAKENAQNEQLCSKITALISLLSRLEKAQLLKLVNSKYLTIDSSERFINSEIAKEVIARCNSSWVIFPIRYVATPLHLVLGLQEDEFNILSLVKILTKAVADVTACDNYGATPYSRAQYYSVCPNVVSYLKKKQTTQ